jgi:two-component system, NtrC family, nitrogen regulation response regulator NtrX
LWLLRMHQVKVAPATITRICDDLGLPPSVAELIAETLIQRGHEARVAVSASHASLIVKTQRPELILLDINLPDSSGTLALGRLRQLRPDVPIIMLTANTDDELARATLRRGAFDDISKPFNIDHLISVVEIALASH